MLTLESSVVLYSDIAKNPAAEKTSLVFNLSAIQQSLDNLFSTSIGERAWQPEYGTSFDQIIGELMSEDTADLMLYYASTAVQRWEPRVILDQKNSKVIPHYEQHYYEVTLVFTVSGMTTNDKFSYTTQIATTITGD